MSKQYKDKFSTKSFIRNMHCCIFILKEYISLISKDMTLIDMYDSTNQINLYNDLNSH